MVSVCHCHGKRGSWKEEAGDVIWTERRGKAGHPGTQTEDGVTLVIILLKYLLYFIIIQLK